MPAPGALLTTTTPVTVGFSPSTIKNSFPWAGSPPRLWKLLIALIFNLSPFTMVADPAVTITVLFPACRAGVAVIVSVSAAAVISVYLAATFVVVLFIS